MDKKNISYPFCLSIDRNGFAYCSTHNHCSGLFFMDELLCMKEAIEKTILIYEKEGITDEYIEDEDKKAMEIEFSRINRLPKPEKKEIVDDLYLIQDTTTGLLKIGRSKNVEGRKKAMQTATGNKLELLCVLKNLGCKEAELHDKFAKYRKEGEWFEFNKSIINEYVYMGGQLLTDPFVKQSKGFVKPTIQEIQDHIIEKGYTFDAEAFYAFYESNGWKVGKNPMKNWKAACTTWAKNRNNNNNNGNYGRETITDKIRRTVEEANIFSQQLADRIGKKADVCDGDNTEVW